MGLGSWVESDNASDLRSEVMDSIANVLGAQLERTDNCFNTPGFIDAALIIEDLFFNGKEAVYLYSEGDMFKVVKATLDMLISKQPDWNPSLQNDISRMITNLQELVDRNADWW